MLAILHGYLLDGSGSNLWTRHIARALSANGQKLHLSCQEPHPEKFSFIGEAYRYENGKKSEIFPPREGNVVLHKPVLGETLPVYVGDQYEEFSRPVPMTDLSDAEIQTYIDVNTKVLTTIALSEKWTCILVNHAVLMSVVALNIHRATGIPFFVIPHGSALEYAVKKQERLRALALDPFREAKGIFVVSPEIATRIENYFPEVELRSKIHRLAVGVDTSQFISIAANQKKPQLDLFVSSLPKDTKGNSGANFTNLESSSSIGDWVNRNQNYVSKSPDCDLQSKIQNLDLNKPIALFIGRLIAAKGAQSLLLALPQILKQVPDLQVIFCGHGPYREILEAAIYAMGAGKGDLLRKIFAAGSPNESASAQNYLQGANDFLAKRDGTEFETFIMEARRVSFERVWFTGYLDHTQLSKLLPLADLGLFPSVVPEAGPMVLLEAMACGVFPMGTYQAGMAANLDTASYVLNAVQQSCTQLSPEPGKTILSIAEKLPKALASLPPREKLSQVTREHFDWKSIAQKITQLIDI